MRTYECGRWSDTCEAVARSDRLQGPPSQDQPRPACNRWPPSPSAGCGRACLSAVSYAALDRHGKPRFYFRRPGFKAVPLPGLPWSPEFMAVYEAALAGQPSPIGGARVRPGTFRALAVSYFASAGFRSMRSSTRSVYRNIIERFCRETDKDGNAHGDKSVATLQREHIVKLMAARAEQPDSANGLRKVLRAMMKHAVEAGMRADDPTRDVRAIRVKTDGFHSWTDDEISQFEAKHTVGFHAR
jgi:hypothetical protein